MAVYLVLEGEGKDTDQYLREPFEYNNKGKYTQTSHTQNGIRTLKNQYFSPQNILKQPLSPVLRHLACISGDAE